MTTNRYPWYQNTTPNTADQDDPRYETPGGAANKIDQALIDAKAYTDAELDIYVAQTTNLADDSVTRPKIAPGAVGAVELDPSLLDYTTDIAVAAKFNEVDAQLADIAINVRSFGAVGDKIVNDRAAIQNAINACPVGGTVFLPPTSNGYLLKNDSPGDTELLLINKPITLVGLKAHSSLVIDDSVPNTSDVIRISPNMVYDGSNYELDGITIIRANDNSGAARHAINLDTSMSGQLFKRLLITRCELNRTAGWSIYTTSNLSDTNGCLFTSQIEKNILLSGIYLNRAGDSIIVSENVITGYNGFYADLVVGSNSLVFEKNNFTARGGFMYKNGNNLKILYNNFEVSYNPMTLVNNAYIDIDGPAADHLYTVDIIGNNLTYRGTAQSAVNGIRVNNSHTTNIEGNYLANNGGQIIVITNQAVNTHLGRNLYSCPSSEGYGYITDNGVDTVRTLTRVTEPTGTVNLYQFSDGNKNSKGATRRDNFPVHIHEAPGSTNAIHRYVYNQLNTGTIKHDFTVARRTTGGGTDTEVELFFFLSNIFAFATQGFAMYNGGDGSRKIQARLAIPTTGTYVKGDIVFNNNPSPGGYVGWVCTASGTPGTWKGFGQIEA